jgi:hypothetical protein
MSAKLWSALGSDAAFPSSIRRLLNQKMGKRWESGVRTQGAPKAAADFNV